MAIIGNDFADYPMGESWEQGSQADRDKIIRLALGRLSVYGIENDTELKAGQEAAVASYIKFVWERDGNGNLEVPVFVINALQTIRRQSPSSFSIDGSLPSTSGGSANVDPEQVREIVNDSVSDWAEEGNTDRIPEEKLPPIPADIDVYEWAELGDTTPIPAEKLTNVVIPELPTTNGTINVVHQTITLGTVTTDYNLRTTGINIGATGDGVLEVGYDNVSNEFGPRSHVSFQSLRDLTIKSPNNSALQSGNFIQAILTSFSAGGVDIDIEINLGLTADNEVTMGCKLTSEGFSEDGTAQCSIGLWQVTGPLANATEDRDVELTRELQYRSPAGTRSDNARTFIDTNDDVPDFSGNDLYMLVFHFINDDNTLQQSTRVINTFRGNFIRDGLRTKTTSDSPSSTAGSDDFIIDTGGATNYYLAKTSANKLLINTGGNTKRFRLDIYKAMVSLPVNVTSGGGSVDLSQIADWAETGNTDTIPDTKISNNIARSALVNLINTEVQNNANGILAKQNVSDTENFAKVSQPNAKIPKSRLPDDIDTNVADWAESGNTDPIPANKLTLAGGGSGGSGGVVSTLLATDPITAWTGTLATGNYGSRSRYYDTGLDWLDSDIDDDDIFVFEIWPANDRNNRPYPMTSAVCSGLHIKQRTRSDNILYNNIFVELPVYETGTGSDIDSIYVIWRTSDHSVYISNNVSLGINFPHRVHIYKIQNVSAGISLAQAQSIIADWAETGNTSEIPDNKIPDLDASKIVKGTINEARLPATAITSDTDIDSRIESWAQEGNTEAIPANKLTNAPSGGGGGGNADVATWAVRNNTDVIPETKIPNLDASKITTGEIAVERLPDEVRNPDVSADLSPDLRYFDSHFHSPNVIDRADNPDGRGTVTIPADPDDPTSRPQFLLSNWIVLGRKAGWLKSAQVDMSNAVTRAGSIRKYSDDDGLTYGGTNGLFRGWDDYNNTLIGVRFNQQPNQNPAVRSPILEVKDPNGITEHAFLFTQSNNGLGLARPGTAVNSSTASDAVPIIDGSVPTSTQGAIPAAGSHIAIYIQKVGSRGLRFRPIFSIDGNVDNNLMQTINFGNEANTSTPNDTFDYQSVFSLNEIFVHHNGNIDRINIARHEGSITDRDLLHIVGGHWNEPIAYGTKSIRANTAHAVYDTPLHFERGVYVQESGFYAGEHVPTENADGQTATSYADVYKKVYLVKVDDFSGNKGNVPIVNETETGLNWVTRQQYVQPTGGSFKTGTTPARSVLVFPRSDFNHPDLREVIIDWDYSVHTNNYNGVIVIPGYIFHYNHQDPTATTNGIPVHSRGLFFSDTDNQSNIRVKIEPEFDGVATSLSTFGTLTGNVLFTYYNGTTQTAFPTDSLRGHTLQVQFTIHRGT